MIFDLASPQVTNILQRNNQPSNQQLSEDLFSEMNNPTPSG